ncbi:MAG: RHS repeat domain-containing protein [Pyrinomonadaceae bacterium]
MLQLSANGQNVQSQQATVDHGFRSDLKIDPSTLALNFEIPLKIYPGRAGVNVPITVYYSSKLWTMEYSGYYQEGPCCEPSFTAYPQGLPTDNNYTWVTVYYGHDAYDNGSNAGWTGSLDFPHIEAGLVNRYNFDGDPCAECPLNQSYFVRRLRVRMPDGSSHELRSSDRTYPATDATDPGVYYSVDASRLKYIAAEQTLYLPDGSRYLMSANPRKFIDRNGNTLIYNNNGTVSDTLNRTVGLHYVSGASPGDMIYSLSGVSGTPANYTFRYRNLGDTGVLTVAQSLRPMGDMMPFGGGTSSPSLFVSEGGSRTTVPELFNPVVLHQLELPNGSKYIFTYNIYGEIDKIVYPSGGYEKFRYEKIPGLDPLNEPYAQANRGVVERWISPDGSDTNLQHWTYAVVSESPYVIRTTNPAGDYSERVLQRGRGPGVIDFGFDDARAGLPIEERFYKANGQMLRRTLMSYDFSGPLPSGYGTATRNALLTKKVDVILDTAGNALASTTEISYDADLNVTSTKHYDYVQIAQATGQTGSITAIPNGTTPLRTEETDYLTDNVDYRARNLLSLPTASRVKDGAGNIVAQTSVSYDEAAYPLLTYGTVNGWTNPGTNVRGNATTTIHWLNFNGSIFSTFPAGSYLLNHAQYDQCGNVRNIWDARDATQINPTQVDYSLTYQYAYPTLNTSADPDGVGPLTSLATSTEYDLATGLVTATIDANLNRTTFAYNDPLNRLKQVVRAADDTQVKNQTSYDYQDPVRKIIVTSDLNSFDDNVLKTVMLYDGLGRTTETQQYEGGTNFIATQTQYDTMGRAHKISNPYRPWQSETPVWTTTTFDALGRVKTVTTPDNAVVTTDYVGNKVTVTDQDQPTGKKRKSVTDALGRLKEVYEDPGSAPELNYLTSYGYDALDNLISVSQGSQQRFFLYDSLKD